MDLPVLKDCLPARVGMDCAGNNKKRTAKFDEDAISSALDDATLMDGDGWIDQVTAERAQPRQSAIFHRHPRAG
jgi:hypothetical protein